VRYAEAASAESLAAQLRATLDDRERAQGMAAAARDRARRFTWESCAAATLEVYRELASRHGTNARRGGLGAT
jgi:glycosyltransferase involved in cell wall biosynthesis